VLGRVVSLHGGLRGPKVVLWMLANSKPLGKATRSNAA